MLFFYSNLKIAETEAKLRPVLSFNLKIHKINVGFQKREL